jgi:hypothetical protein
MPLALLRRYQPHLHRWVLQRELMPQPPFPKPLSRHGL